MARHVADDEPDGHQVLWWMAAARAACVLTLHQLAQGTRRRSLERTRSCKQASEVALASAALQAQRHRIKTASMRQATSCRPARRAAWRDPISAWRRRGRRLAAVDGEQGAGDEASASRRCPPRRPRRAFPHLRGHGAAAGGVGAIDLGHQRRQHGGPGGTSTTLSARHALRRSPAAPAARAWRWRGSAIRGGRGYHEVDLQVPTLGALAQVVLAHQAVEVDGRGCRRRPGRCSTSGTVARWADSSRSTPAWSRPRAAGPGRSTNHLELALVVEGQHLQHHRAEHRQQHRATMMRDRKRRPTAAP